MELRKTLKVNFIRSYAGLDSLQLLETTFDNAMGILNNQFKKLSGIIK